MGDPLCMGPLTSTTILGMLIGEWLMSARSKENKVKMIAGAGVLCLATGYALSPFIPIIMRITTTSYVPVSAGWACLMFLVFYWAIDVRGHREWTLPFVVSGSNSILIYMFARLLSVRHWVSIFSESMAGTSQRMEPLLQAVVVLVVQWVMLFRMYRNKIFLKA
jgi:predicted acyltransferase